MHLETTHERPEITYKEMEKFLYIAWGPLGKKVAETWRDYNKIYFNNTLKPIPIILVNVSPYGHWCGCTSCNVNTKTAHLIQLAMPSKTDILTADKGVLLHEMLHQSLTEQGDNPSHNGTPWCKGIMNLHQKITKKSLWASPSKVGKVKDIETGERKSKRFHEVCPDTGKESIPMKAIATWPHSVGLKLGPF